MFLEGLDALDQRIVQLLIENARMSYSDIGQAVGISRVAVKARIQALEQRGVIEEYTTIINPQKISGAVSCYFEIETRPDTLAEVTDRLAANETVTQIYRVTGKDKLHVHAVAASSEEMERLIREVIDPLPGVVSCSCNIILSRIKDIKGRQGGVPLCWLQGGGTVSRSPPSAACGGSSPAGGAPGPFARPDTGCPAAGEASPGLCPCRKGRCAVC